MYSRQFRLVRALILTHVAIGLTVLASAASADRTVLAPTGDTLGPNSYRAEFAINPQTKFQNREWIEFSTPQGIEVDAERFDLSNERKKGYALSIQYPLTYSLVSALPAVAVGVRDVTGTGSEHGAFYIAATKTFRLSDAVHRFVREFKVDAGAGTGRIGGLFLGAQTKLSSGLRLQAELYKRRPNITLALPITPHLDVRAYSLDRQLFYGLSFSVLR